MSLLQILNLTIENRLLQIIASLIEPKALDDRIFNTSIISVPDFLIIPKIS